MAAPTRDFPRTIQVSQVELNGEWYDLELIRVLVRAASAWSPSFFGSSEDRSMYFEEKTTLLVEQEQIDSLLKRGWAQDDGLGSHKGTAALLEAVDLAGGLPTKA